MTISNSSAAPAQIDAALGAVPTAAFIEEIVGAAGVNAVPPHLINVPAANEEAAPEEVRLQVVPGKLNENVVAAEKALAATGEHYQRDGRIVTVMTDPSSKETLVREASKTSLSRDLDSTTVWERPDKHSGGWLRIEPPSKYCTMLLNAREYEHLPVLNGIARQPHMRQDGTLCSSSGYDAATGLYGAFDDRQFDVPASPTADDAKAALATLEDLLTEFNFPAESDRSAAVSAMLTAAVRTSLNVAPMFHVRAPQIGSGKSYLCEIITAFATARRGTPFGFPASDAECTKLLLAELLTSPGAIEFDNLTSDIVPHKSLCTGLTSEYLKGRILGATRTASVSTRTLLLSSGNNVGPVADMARRCITINLEPASENPVAHEFKRPNLMREVLANRGRYVIAALTVVRAWIVAGRPDTVCKTFNSYASWSDWCRQPLLWLGRADPTDAVFEGMAEDPDREALGNLLVALKDQFGSAPTMVKAMVKRASERRGTTDELLEVLQDIAGANERINRKRLGHWIKRHSGRVVNGLKIVKAPVTRNAQCWRVESVLSVVSDSVQPVGAVTTPAMDDDDFGELLIPAG